MSRRSKKTVPSRPVGTAGERAVAPTEVERAHTWSRRSFLRTSGGAAVVGAVGFPTVGRTAAVTKAAEAVRLPKALTLDEVPTPALLVDIDVLEANLRRMAGHARRAGVELRPHTKTHKCPLLAQRQIELGAIGVCAAKVSEAEVMVDAGIENVLITSPVVTPEKIARVMALAKRTSGIQMVVDSERNARDFDEAADAAGVALRVLIGLDTGTRRTGIALGEPALALAKVVDRATSLRLDGVQAYAGHVMHVDGWEERRRRSREALDLCLETKALLEENGFEIGVFSGGGTGTFDIDSEIDGVTDLQVGSYLFMDVQYRLIGDAESEVFDAFEPSLFVLATAISQPVPDRITLDAGYKAFANEPSAKPVFRDLEGLQYHYGGDEHGIVGFDTDERPLHVGDKAQLLVSHCDPTVNLYDHYHAMRDGRVSELWPIAARGHSQ